METKPAKIRFALVLVTGILFLLSFGGIIALLTANSSLKNQNNKLRLTNDSLVAANWSLQSDRDKMLTAYDGLQNKYDWDLSELKKIISVQNERISSVTTKTINNKLAYKPDE